MEENFQYLYKVAEKLTYKSGYYFLVRRIDKETALVSLRCPLLPDSGKSGGLAGLTMNNTVTLSTIVSPGDALQAFAKVISDFELHEASEFFQFDGNRVFLPHGWNNDSDDTNKFSWKDFRNLSGKFLMGLKKFLGEI